MHGTLLARRSRSICSLEGDLPPVRLSTSGTTRGRRCDGGSGTRSRAERLEPISALQERVLHDRDVLSTACSCGSRSTSARCSAIPRSFARFRTQVVPLLRTYPFIRIWHAGCSTGEEVVLDGDPARRGGALRSLPHLRDRHERARSCARRKAGIFPLDAMQEYTRELPPGRRHALVLRVLHRASTITRCFIRRCSENIMFAEHNLATDGSFNEFNVILCRNVMIYFNTELQARVHQLFYESLAPVRHSWNRRPRVAAVHPARGQV